MTATEEIHKAQGRVAKMQCYLADVQDVLGAAEEVATTGRAMKRGLGRLFLVSIALAGAGALLLLWGRKRKQQRAAVAAASSADDPST